jgi:hypothetical protein
MSNRINSAKVFLQHRKKKNPLKNTYHKNERLTLLHYLQKQFNIGLIGVNFGRNSNMSVNMNAVCT